MGFKLAMAFGGLAVVSVLTSITSLFLPQTRISFFTLGLVRLFTLNLKVLTFEINPKYSDVCNLQNLMEKNGELTTVMGFDLCDDVTSGSLQDVGQRLCGTQLQVLMPTMCTTVMHSYYFGFMAVGVVIVNALLVCTAAGLLVAYVSSETPKQNFRVNALAIHGFATLLLVGGMLVYFFMVVWTVNIDYSAGGGLMGAVSGAFLSANGQGGTSIGFFLWCTAGLIQLIMAVLAMSLASSREMSKEEIAEMREQSKLEAMEQPSYGTPAGVYYQPVPVMVPQPLPHAQPYDPYAPQGGAPQAGAAMQPAW